MSRRERKMERKAPERARRIAKAGNRNAKPATAKKQVPVKVK
jgi:hypothetical protein